MSQSTTVTATTNTRSNSCVTVKCQCSTLWSMALQFGYKRLSTTTDGWSGRLINSFAVRARRIAGTYARFYLETEEGGTPSKKGRYYWMALGAFASKTVACTLESSATQALSSGGITATIPILQQLQIYAKIAGNWENPLTFGQAVSDGLGKGNFWLFCDISGWHWYYNNYRSSFDICMEERNADNHDPHVKEITRRLPWSAEALPKINQMRPSSYLREGFRLVKEIEEETNSTRRNEKQYEHLMAIANHEQRAVLQPLIYESHDFAWWIQQQRIPRRTLPPQLQHRLRRILPPLQLAFTHACDTDDERLISRAPEDIQLENVESRMDWIKEAAKIFHDLMQTHSTYMEQELRTMAGWYQAGDR